MKSVRKNIKNQKLFLTRSKVQNGKSSSNSHSLGMIHSYFFHFVVLLHNGCFWILNTWLFDVKRKERLEKCIRNLWRSIMWKEDKIKMSKNGYGSWLRHRNSPTKLTCIHTTNWLRVSAKWLWCAHIVISTFFWCAQIPFNPHVNL